MTNQKDPSGIVHAVQGDPYIFATQEGGLPGQTACGRQFYDANLGAQSCSFPRVMPFDKTYEEVTCMACIAATQ